MNEAKIVGPFPLGAASLVLELVQGDQTLGKIIYCKSVPAVMDVIPREGPIHDLLVREARSRGLLYGEDIHPDLLYDVEQEGGS